jgi:hypothetical protein
MMDLRFIIKDFNPTAPPEQKVDNVLEVKVNEIECIKNRLLSLEDLLKAREVEPPDYFENVSLTDDEISKVRTYLLYVWKTYFPDIPLSKTMRQQFIWNIPRPVYETFDYCQMSMYPDILNPMFWMFMNCVDLQPDVICSILTRSFDIITKDDIVFAHSVIDEWNPDNDEEENENNAEESQN